MPKHIKNELKAIIKNINMSFETKDKRELNESIPGINGIFVIESSTKEDT